MSRGSRSSGASNLTGFAPDLRAAVAMTHEAGARLHVDAVARAPHLPIDVDGWGIDSLVTSPYKWYGPHAGILVLAPEDLLHGVEPYRVRPADYRGADRWETGTKSFESIAGIRAAADFLLEHPWDEVVPAEHALLERMEDGLRYGARRDGAHATCVGRRAGADDDLHRRRPRTPTPSRRRWPSAASRCGAATATPASSSTRWACAPQAASCAPASSATPPPTTSTRWWPP